MKPERLTWPPACREAADDGSTSVEELQRKTQQHARSIEDTLSRTLRTADEAAQTGAATLEVLHRQGDQLRHIRREQQNIDAELDASSRLLRGLESWRGAAYNALSGWFSSSSQPSRASGSASSASSSSSSSGGSSKAQLRDQRGWPPDSTSAARAAPAGSQLNQLSSIVGDLHAQAQAMNSAIGEQSTTIDETLAAAESQHAKLKSHEARTKALR
jgi:methyl-accepting chemotaxis protein